MRATVDTGAVIPLIRRAMIRNEDIIPFTEKVSLKALIRSENVPIHGETGIELCMGKLRLEQRIMVAAIEDEFIMGMNIL